MSPARTEPDERRHSLYMVGQRSAWMALESRCAFPDAPFLRFRLRFLHFLSLPPRLSASTSPFSPSPSSVSLVLLKQQYALY